MHFQIVADGRVSVRHGRRVITTLSRGDTFGEWGIGHQRGVRAADVVADRPTRPSAQEEHRTVVANTGDPAAVNNTRSLLGAPATPGRRRHSGRRQRRERDRADDRELSS